MTLGPALLLRDQFVRGGDRSGPVWSEVVLLALPLVPAGLVIYWDVCIPAVTGLLTATSILTGLIFTMALRFWERSIDARSDPKYVANGRMLYVLDRMRSHLVWTVLVGVIATGYLALTVVFASAALPVWSSAIVTFLCLYEVVLVGGSLLRFYELSYLLRP